MKTRILFLILLFIYASRTFALPPETSYVANTAIKASGSSIDDVSYGPFNVGFTFNFYGNDYTQFYVTSNGLIMFGGGSTVYTNECIPSSNAPNNYIGAFWDDIMIDGTGAIYYQTIGAAPNRKLIVQWTNMTIYGSPVLMGTFTAILYETSNNIQVQYRSIVDPIAGQPHGNSATIGLENSGGTAGVQYSCNLAGSVDSEKAFLFTRSGATYTINSNATYEGVLLVEASPYPGIPGLVSPANNATIGVSTNFQWSAATNATSYSLHISSNSDLSSSTSYSAGTNLNYTPPDFSTGITRYWAVWATNASGTTWSEIRKITTSATPPLAAVPQTTYVELTQDVSISMAYSGGDASTKTAIITSLPTDGALYQYNAGVRGAQISSVPTTLTDASLRIIYAATGTSGNGKGNFNFKIHDNTGDSPTALLTVNVSPLGAPNFMRAAKSTNQIELQFDKLMADPTGKEGQFTVSDGSGAVSISSAALKSGDNYSIILTMGRSLTGTVNISYTAGTIASSVGGLLLSFSSQIVSLTAQTISFSALTAKNYGDAPFTLSATASSGLAVTFSSSNTSVATISGTTCTITGAGTTTITATQAGNGTYSQATYAQVLTVNKQNQTITFSALANKNVGDADFDPSATATSGLAVTYASSNTAVATIVLGKIHVVATGTSIITASQTGNGTYNAAPDITQTLTVGKLNQTITFGALPAKTYGNADFAPGATASSSLTVTYASSNTSVATIVAGNIHILSPGTTVITASQAGNTSYNAAPDVTQNLTVNKANQTITFNALATKAFGDADVSPGATSNSGLTVTYASGNTSVATIVAGNIHIIGAGTSVITASQSGDGNYNAASDVTQTLTVNKANQTITFGALAAKVFGDADLDPGATSSSSLTVSYSSGNTSVATIVSGKIHIISSGTSVITASQAGNSNYNAASNVLQTLTVNKASQTITFGSLVSKVFGDVDADPNASSTSALAISYSSGNLSVATIVAGKIHILGAGTSEITASQAGDGNYNAASDVIQTLTVNKANQTITFGLLASKIPSDPDFDPGANASSGLTISYSSDNTSVATIVAGKIHIVSAGSVLITASQTGGVNYNSAPDESQTLIVSKVSQTITFNAISDKTYGSVDFDPGASSSSGQAISYATDNPAVATIVAGNIHIVGVGTTEITASQAGNAVYNPAVDVSLVLTVIPANLTVIASDMVKTYGDANPALSISYSGFVGFDDESVLNTVPTATTLATQYSDVGSYTISASGGIDDNYSFIYTDGTLTINKKLLTVTAEDKVKTFGDVNPAFTLVYTGFAGSDNESVLSTVPVATSVADETSGVGPYAIVPANGVDANYSFNYVNGSLTISKKTITVTADDKGKSYGDPNPALTITYTGLVNGDDASVINTPPLIGTTADLTSGVGSYPITLTGGSDDNYNFTLVNGGLIVNLRTLIVSVKSHTKKYGDPNPEFTFTYNGFATGDDEGVLNQAPVVNCLATTSSSAGDYVISASGGSDDLYSFFYEDGTLTIDKKDLQITADNKTKVYGEANPMFTLSYSGFINGEDAAVLDELPIVTTPANETSHVGAYTLTPSGGTDNNYTYLYTVGNLSVTKKEITATAENKSRPYGVGNPEFTVLYTGLVNGDHGSLISSPPNTSTTADVTSPVDTYPITMVGGADDNYTMVLVDGTLTVNKKTLMVIAENKTKIYGEPNPLLTFTYAGFVNGEDVTVLNEIPVVNTDVTETSAAGSYPIVPSGGSDDNYDFSFVNGLMDITKKMLTVTADNKYKVVGDVNPELTVAYSGFVNGDTPDAFSTTPQTTTVADVSSIAGDYEIVPSNGVSNNYDFTYINGVLKITNIAGDKNGDGVITSPEIAGDKDCDGKIVPPEIVGDLNGDGKIVSPEIAGDKNGDGIITLPELAGDLNGDGVLTNPEIAGDIDGDGIIDGSEIAGDNNGDGKIEGSEITGDTNGDGIITSPEIAGDLNGDGMIVFPEIAGDTNGDGKIDFPELAGDLNGDGKFTSPEIAGDLNGDGKIDSPEIAGDTNGDGKIVLPELTGDNNGNGKIDVPEISGDLNGDGKIDGSEITGDLNGDGKIISPEIAGDTNGNGKIDGSEISGDINGDGKITAPEVAGDTNGDGKITTPEVAGDINGDGKIDGSELAGDTNGDGKLIIPEVAGDTNGDGKITTPEIAGDANGDGKVAPPELVGDTNGDGKLTGLEVAGDVNGDGKITSPEVAGDINGDGKITTPEIVGDINGDGKITSPEIAGDANGDGKITAPEIAGDANGDDKITAPEIVGDLNGDGEINSPEIAGDLNGDGKITAPEVAGDINGDGIIIAPEIAGDINGDGIISSPEIAGDIDGDGKITSPEVAGDINGDGIITSPEIVGDINGDGKITSPEIAGDINGDGKITNPEIAGDINGDGKITSPEIAGDINGDGTITSPELAGDVNGDGEIKSPEIVGDTNGDGNIVSPELVGDLNGDGKYTTPEVAGDRNGDGVITSPEVYGDISGTGKRDENVSYPPLPFNPETDHANVKHLFSPNSDGFNDTWKIPEIADYGRVEVKIYNRWGGLVYESSNYQNDWDGTSDGNQLPDGAYYYFLKTENAGSKTGVINIVR